MIVFFGPAGAGKSVQGQMLAARQGWRWLSAGQLLRDTRDSELLTLMNTGALVPVEKISEIMGDALARAADANIDKVIVDGFPRELSQAEWLVQAQTRHSRPIELIVVLEVPKSELLKRLTVRGRVDDTPEVIDERMRIYRSEMYPILSYFTEKGIAIVHIDGTGTVGQVHDRIVEELVACQLV